MTDAQPPRSGRRRLPPAESRDAALDAARALLVEHGPPGVTLKAVAARIGRTHATVLHHFGSAAGLQEALIARMATVITTTIRDAVMLARAEARGGTRSPDADPAAGIVDLVFDSFGAGGAGALASWMILTGNRNALDPILRAVHDLVDDLAADVVDTRRAIADETLQLMLLALGDALLGAPMASALGVPRARARELARHLLPPRADIGDSGIAPPP